MPFKPVDQAIKVVIGPLISSSDFTSVLASITDPTGVTIRLYREDVSGNIDAANFAFGPAGNFYTWTNLTYGMYSVTIPATGGSFANNECGILFIRGSYSGALEFRSTIYDVVPESVYDALFAGTELLEVSSAQLGSGAYAFVITVIKSGPTALVGARVTVSQNDVVMASDTTDNDGEVTFNLNNGDYDVAITLTGYVFSGDTFTVSGASSDTFTMTALSLTASSIGKTTAYSTVLSHLGVAEPNITISAVARSAHRTITGFMADSLARTAVSDSAGLVQFTNMLKGVTYRFTRGTGRRGWDLMIPLDAGSTYELPAFVGGSD